MEYKKKNPRRLNYLLDIIHIVIGIAVVILSVIAFLSPEEHLAFFPMIFFLAALLALVNGAARVRMPGPDSRRLAGLAALAAGVLLLLIAVISAMVML